MAIAAVGLMIPPITRWYITMTMGTDDLAAKMERQTILQDKWNTLNATSFDEIAELITAKGGSSWSENVGKYTITTTIDAAGKYANAACADETPGEDDRQCRKVHLTIKDNETGQTQALDVTKIAPENGGGGGDGGLPDYTSAKSITLCYKYHTWDRCSMSATWPGMASITTQTTTGSNSCGSYAGLSAAKLIAETSLKIHASGVYKVTSNGAPVPAFDYSIYTKKGDTVWFYASYVGDDCAHPSDITITAIPLK